MFHCVYLSSSKNGGARKRRSGWDQTNATGECRVSWSTRHSLIGASETFLFNPSPTEKEPEQTGRLISPATLPVLNAEQLQALQLAKRYCQDVSGKFVSQWLTMLSVHSSH